MNDVRETLAELVQRRLRELGSRHGRTEPLSLREAWLPYEGRISYETLRRIEKGTHTNVRGETADVLALILDVPVSEVEYAAGMPPRQGAFRLPPRADRLDKTERQVVLAVVDIILRAKGGGRDESSPAPIGAVEGAQATTGISNPATDLRHAEGTGDNLSVVAADDVIQGDPKNQGP